MFEVLSRVIRACARGRRRSLWTSIGATQTRMSVLKVSGFRSRLRLKLSKPPTRATFSDVPVGATGFAEVETAFKAGITSGCGSGKFCPGTELTRAHGAVFIARAFNLSDINPCADKPTLKGVASNPET